MLGKAMAARLDRQNSGVFTVPHSLFSVSSLLGSAFGDGRRGEVSAIPSATEDEFHFGQSQTPDIRLGAGAD